MANVYPDYFARFYDLIYHSLRDGVDSEFFMEKILGAKGPVLEIGTGTGRFFKKAFEEGADIHGIDVSPDMLNVLKSKLPEKEHHRASVQSMENFRLRKSFKLIIAPFRVFSHILAVADQLKALQNVHDHLDKNGIFIFDLFIPNLQMLTEGITGVTDFEGEYEPGKKMRRVTSMYCDYINQINHITMRFEWDTGTRTEVKEWKTPFRIFFRYELEHLLKLSPFKEFEIYGDHLQTPLNEDSKEFVVVCKKGLVW